MLDILFILFIILDTLAIVFSQMYLMDLVMQHTVFTIYTVCMFML